jgi:hypothetical protein
MTHMRRITYRPYFTPTPKLFGHPLNDVPPIRVGWRSGHRLGISTDDLAEALAWMAEARALGQTVILPAPLRKLVERGAGSSTLECGHVVDSPSWHTKHVRCAICLPLAERLLWLKKLKRKPRCFP